MFCLGLGGDITTTEEKQAASKVEGRLGTQTIHSVNTEYTCYKCTHLALRLLKTLLIDLLALGKIKSPN